MDATALIRGRAMVLTAVATAVGFSTRQLEPPLVCGIPEQGGGWWDQL
jgi:hypothetical protein